MTIYGVIYKITDKFGHCYIGKRRGDGSDIGKTYFGSGTHIKRAVKKHGKDYFTYWVFEKCYSLKQLNEMEIYYIKFFQARINGYNLTNGGDGFTGKHTEESKKKISETNINKSKEEKLLENKKRSESGKIAQNRTEVKNYTRKMSKISQNKPEVKAKKLEKWNNKSTKQKLEINSKRSNSMRGKNTGPHSDDRIRKNSDAQKIAKNKPEVKLLQSEIGKYVNHIRWHKTRNIINPDCKFCKG
jgi:hypothetical protein